MIQDHKFEQVKNELNRLNEKVEMGGATSIVETLVSLLHKLKVDLYTLKFCTSCLEIFQRITCRLHVYSS